MEYAHAGLVSTGVQSSARSGPKPFPRPPAGIRLDYFQARLDVTPVNRMAASASQVIAPAEDALPIATATAADDAAAKSDLVQGAQPTAEGPAITTMGYAGQPAGVPPAGVPDAPEAVRDVGWVGAANTSGSLRRLHQQEVDPLLEQVSACFSSTTFLLDMRAVYSCVR